MLIRADSGAVHIGQLNVWNWFDTVDDPRTRDTVYTPEQYSARIDKLSALIAGPMGLPDVIAMQEIENDRSMRDLLAAPALAGAGYRYVLGANADTRGIRNAVIYRDSRVRLVSSRQPDPAADLRPRDPSTPRDEDLFARAPMIARFALRASAPGDALDGARFTVVANHFKSKLGGEVHEPRRLAQGAFVAGIVDAERGARPDVPVLVVGDLNATPGERAYERLVTRADGTARLIDTTERLAADDRYTFIYRGQRDLLDHIMVTPDLAHAVEGVRILHVNAGTTNRTRFAPGIRGTSDHDPLLAMIQLGSRSGVDVAASAAEDETPF